MVAKTGNRNDDDKNSFINDSNGDVARNVSLSGSINTAPSGLQTDFRITTMDITDTETAIPATPLTGRNSFSVYNTSTVDTLYIGKTGLTADTVLGTTSGWEVGPQETSNIDAKATIIFYGRTQTGKTVRVKVFEVA